MEFYDIDNIGIFDDDKIHFHNLELLDLSFNPIKKGLEVLKKNFFKKCSRVKLDLSLEELKVIINFNSPTYYLDIFVNNLNEITNFFEKDKIKFGALSSEKADKFKEIFDLTDEEIEAKREIPYNNSYRPFIYYDPSLGRDSCSSDEFDRPNIITDNGTGYYKAGFSGEEGPRSVSPTIVGYPKYFQSMIGGDKKEFFVGADAEAKRGVLKLNYPIKYSIIDNWDDMDKVWGHIFTYELRTAPEEHNVMLTQFSKDCYETKLNREKMAQIMFEFFNVPALYIADPATLSMYSIGKYTGLAIDSGDGGTSISPIFDGFPLRHALALLRLAGRDHTELMRILLYEVGKNFSTTAENEIVKDIKEKACYVALDYDEEFKCFEPFDYELPDGNHVIIKDQRFRCPEALFKPSLCGLYDQGIDYESYWSIQKCDIDIRKELYSNIVLSGGNTMYNGLVERLTKEIKSLAPESMKEEVKVIASPGRKFAAWIGGSILSSLSTFESMWITKTEFEENGASIVHKKCF